MKAITEEESNYPRLHPDLWWDEGDARIEQLRSAAEANWQRRERQLMVYKAWGVVSLTFLICGSVLAIVYAFWS